MKESSTLIKKWDWSVYVIELHLDYYSLPRPGVYVVRVNLPKTLDRSWIELVVSIRKPSSELGMDDVIDALGRKAQRQALRGKTLGRALDYCMSLRRERRMEMIGG